MDDAREIHPYLPKWTLWPDYERVGRYIYFKLLVCISLRAKSFIHALIFKASFVVNCYYYYVFNIIHSLFLDSLAVNLYSLIKGYIFYYKNIIKC